MRFRYTTNGVCSRAIHFDLDENDGKVRDISFEGGCDGNLKALCTVLDGWTPQEIAGKLLGNTCGYKNTSCMDQFSRAVLSAEKQLTQKKAQSAAQ